MNLGEELFEVKTKKSASKIGPVEYYLSLAELIDNAPDAIEDPYESILTSTRRMEALLEDRLAASGQGLYPKISSAADRIPINLRVELYAIAAWQAELQTAINHGKSPSRPEIATAQSRCAQALVQTLYLAEAASPPDPTIRIKAFLPVWVRR